MIAFDHNVKRTDPVSHGLFSLGNLIHVSLSRALDLHPLRFYHPPLIGHTLR